MNVRTADALLLSILDHMQRIPTIGMHLSPVSTKCYILTYI